MKISHHQMDYSLTIFLFFFFSIALLPPCTTAADTIAANQTLRDGETIVSASESFEMGFFSPSNSTPDRYFGIWYKRLATDTIAWVANRDNPIANRSGMLRMDGEKGVLELLNATGGVVWSTSSTSGSARNPVARLLDSGNLMIMEETKSNPAENYIWQSFDHPTDTFLPGMKFGKNFVTGLVTNFTSWKSSDDPSEGEYVVYMDTEGLPQVYQKKGSVIQYSIGSWNGLRFTGMPSLKPNQIYTFEYVFNETEVYYTFNLINSSVITKMRLSTVGDMDRLNWIDETKGWFLYSTPTTDNCVRYALCGAYGSCDINNSPPCGCLRGFTPRNPQQWNLADWSSGCQREIPLDCGAQEGFRLYSDLKLPDTRNVSFNRSMTLAECEVECKRDCNCTAYTTLDIKYGTGCLMWHGELIDMRMYPENGQDVYIRMAAAELAKDTQSSKKRTRVRIIVIPIVVALTITLGLCFCYVRRRLQSKGRRDSEEDPIYEKEKNDLDLPLFSLSTLLGATNNFSFNNKLGEGGFGPVYKGLLEGGREIAVKRLSDTSTQGTEEFKNEVIFISKLQHRNLVKILGCCVEGEEKMLVYEYMPNKGLDSILFDETQKKTLDWPTRFHIINGIARGLLYLHQDSRLRIIHRDLKAANILLDLDMNPKISDFGMARSFGGNDSETNTKRVVGTYGYMSPEYAADGIFSVKSDVFSFGVLVLEIVSGKKNRGFFHQDHNHNLLGHAWRLYNEGRAVELVDQSLSISDYSSEVLRSIHVALLCVQHSPDDRPNMSSVILMLSSEGILTRPKRPGFYVEDSKFGPESSSSMQTPSSNGDTSITLLETR